MFELNETELKLLEGMGVRKEGELFFDEQNGGRVFQFVRKHEDYDFSTLTRRDELSKTTLSYVSGDKRLILSREYCIPGSEPLDMRLMNFQADKFIILYNGVWYALTFKGNTCTCEFSIAYDHESKKEIKKPIEVPVVGFGDPLPKELIGTYREPWERDYPSELDEYELVVSISREVGFSLEISGSKNKSRARINCDGETISAEESPNENLPFSYENFVSIVKRHVGTVKELNAAAPFMCDAVIPIMVDYTIKELERLLRSRESDEDEKQLECLSRIYEEFTKHTESEKDESAKSPLRKCFGEIQKR